MSLSILDLVARGQLLQPEPLGNPSGPDIEAGYAALPGRRHRQPRRLGMSKHSLAHLKHLKFASQCAKNARQSKASKELDDLRLLRGYWNGRQLRHGDKCKVSYGSSRVKVHANVWDVHGCHLNAYRCVGKRAMPTRVHLQLGHTRRSLELVAACAQVHVRALRSACDLQLVAPLKHSGVVGLFVQRAYDATPWRVSFGRLATIVAPAARYFVKDEHGKWKALRLLDFMALHKQSMPGRGVLELLAQNIEVSIACRGSVLSHKIILPPCFLENTKGSTIFAATERALPGFSTDDLGRLATTGAVPYIFIGEVPDACKANRRKRAEVIHRLRDINNIFVTPIEGCCVHAILGIVNATSAPEDLSGDIHAAAVVHSSVSNHLKVVSAFKRHFEDNFVWNVDEDPNPEWAAHIKDILRETLGEDIRGSTDVSGAVLHLPQSEKKMQDILEKSDFMNWDPRQRQYIHYERSCGQCATFEEAQSNCLAACIECGVVVGQSQSQPAKNRWGTMHTAQCKQSPGLMINQSSRHCYRIAFSKWEEGDPGADSSDDFRKIMRGKCFRTMKVTGSRLKQIRLLSSFFCEKPITHLWQRLEYLDELGSSLLDICTPCRSPFEATIGQLKSIAASPPRESSLKTLYVNLASDEPELRLCKTIVFDKAACMIVLLDWKFRCFKEWPFPLIEGICSSMARRLEICEQFLAAKAICHYCLEPLMAEKMANLWKDACAMAEDLPFWTALHLWSKKLKVCNMHIERLLALVKQSVVQDGTPAFMERVAANGYLCQWITDHIKAGGYDPRVECAQQLIDQHIPLKRAEKSTRQASKRGGLRPSTVFANERIKHESYTKDQYHAALKTVRAKYHLLDESERAKYERQVAERKASKIVAGATRPQPTPCRNRPCRSDVLFGLSSDGLPLSSEEFVKAALADAAVSANCGFRSWGPQARCEFSDAVYVADAGDIPPSKTFHIKKSCWQSHPGVCVGQDADSALYIRAGKALCSFAISHDLQRTWFKLAVVADSDINVVVDGLELLAYCATIRRADPRVALFLLGAFLGVEVSDVAILNREY